MAVNLQKSRRRLARLSQRVAVQLFITAALLSCAVSPENKAVTLLNEADIAYERGFLEIAEQKYRAAAETVPNDAYAYFKLGNLYSKQGNYDEAIAAYRTVLNVDPRHAKAYNNLTVIYLILAEQTLKTALHKLPNSDQNLRQLMDHHFSLRKFLRLDEELSKSAKNDP